ncbi:helix-turn-helix transcriptional regulator [Verrucomicrobiota bacterium]
MEQRCSLAPKPTFVTGLRLRVVWDVRADPSYDVRRATVPDERALIAVRTLGGLGRLQIRDGGPEFALTADTLLVIERQKILRYWCAADVWSFHWFEFEAHGALQAPLYRMMSVSSHPDDPTLFESLFVALRQEHAAKRAYAGALFQALLCRWLAEQEADAAKHPQQDKIERIIDRMHDEVGHDGRVEDMAREAGMNVRSFRDAFRAVTGESPKRFYDRLRMETAAEMLRSGAYNVSEAAEQLSFCNAFHFSKVFKRHFGVAPSELARR